MWRWLLESGFYISMTESDGASLSLMEAMAVGAIPVVSDIEPNREWVKNGVNGVLVPLDDEAVAISGVEGLSRAVGHRARSDAPAQPRDHPGAWQHHSEHDKVP